VNKPKKGKRRTESGYIRISAGMFRHWYEHRVIILKLILEWNYYNWTKKKKKFTVHHIDFKNNHNCSINLLLLDSRIHQAFINDYRNRIANGWFAPQVEPPDWVTE